MRNLVTAVLSRVACWETAGAHKQRAAAQATAKVYLRKLDGTIACVCLMYCGQEEELVGSQRRPVQQLLQPVACAGHPIGEAQVGKHGKLLSSSVLTQQWTQSF
jgi:hypothetical protein